jgi:type II secretory pathway component PulM
VTEPTYQRTIDNALPATASAKLKGITTAPPFDRPAVRAAVEVSGSRRTVDGRAVAWTREAVQVELTLAPGDTREVWLHAEDVTRR